MGCTIACNGAIAHWHACELDYDNGDTMYNVNTLCFNEAAMVFMRTMCGWNSYCVNGLLAGFKNKHMPSSWFVC